jgi:flagellar motor protein MotB
MKRSKAGLLSNGHDDEEENFFVSFSDLMTGVLFIFVILTTAMALHYHLKEDELTSQRLKADEAHAEAQRERANAEREKQAAVTAATIASEEAKKAGEARANALKVQAVMDAMAKVLKQREQRRKEELEGLAKQLKEKDLTVELDETNGILRLPERLLFKTGEATLQSDGETALALLAAEMLPIVQRGCSGGDLKWEAIYIEGHTDNVPISGRFPSNWELSSARAISTLRALVKAEPRLDAMRNEQGKPVLGISGYADQRAVAENVSEEGRRKNRRIDIRFVMAYPSRAEIQAMEQRIERAGAATPAKP